MYLLLGIFRDNILFVWIKRGPVKSWVGTSVAIYVYLGGVTFFTYICHVHAPCSKLQGNSSGFMFLYPLCFSFSLYPGMVADGFILTNKRQPASQPASQPGAI